MAEKKSDRRLNRVGIWVGIAAGVATVLPASGSAVTAVGDAAVHSMRIAQELMCPTSPPSSPPYFAPPASTPQIGTPADARDGFVALANGDIYFSGETFKPAPSAPKLKNADHAFQYVDTSLYPEIAFVIYIDGDPTRASTARMVQYVYVPDSYDKGEYSDLTGPAGLSASWSTSTVGSADTSPRVHCLM